MQPGADRRTRGIAALNLARAAIVRARRAVARAGLLLTDRRAASAAMTAMTLPLLIGFMGLAMDVGVWQMNKHRLQGAADQAAYSVAIAKSKQANVTQARTEATALLARLGYVNGANGITVDIRNPPTAGAYTGDTDAWQVSISRPQTLYFSKLFLNSGPLVVARAVARAGGTPGWGCILSLHPTAAGANSFTNNADTAAGCDVYTNSSSASALQCDNNCDIFGNTYTVGGNAVTNHGTLHGDINDTGVSAATNPYAGLPVPTAASLTCTSTTAITAKSPSPSTISPGVYCGGIDVAANKTLTMTPGTYYIKTKFNMAGNSTLNATGGVTIILLGDLCLGTGACIKEKGLGNNVTINLTAPTTGTYAGIAMYMVGTGTTTVLQEFSNNVDLNIQGVLYAPHHKFSFHNNAQFNNTLCAQVVSAMVSFENNADMGANCDNTGVQRIGGTDAGPTEMVE